MGGDLRPSEVGVTCRVEARERRTSGLSASAPQLCGAAGETEASSAERDGAAPAPPVGGRVDAEGGARGASAGPSRQVRVKLLTVFFC